MKNRWILLIILITAALLRLYKLGDIPKSMYVDEVAIGVDAQSIAQTGKDMHGNSVFSTMFPSYGDYKLPAYIWFASLTTKMFGASAFAVRLPSALAGIGTVLFMYLLAKELFFSLKEKEKELVALSIAGVTALLPWSILFSRTGFEGHVGQFLLVVATYLSLRARKRPAYFLLAASVGALSAYTYFSVRFVFPVILLATSLFFRKKNLLTQLLWLGGGLVVFAILLIPLLRSPYYEVSNRFRLSTKNVLSDDSPIVYANTLRDLDGNSAISRLFHHRITYRLKNLARNYFAHIDFSYLFLSGDENLRHSTGEVGIMYLAFLPFFLSGIYAFGKKHRKTGIFLLIWYLAALLPASVPSEVPHALRSLNALGVLSVVTGIGVYEVFYWCMKQKGFTTLIASTVVIIALSTNVFIFIHDYVVHYPLRSEKAWSFARKGVGEFVRQNKNSAGRVIVTGDNKLFLWILFYGNYNYADIQRISSKEYLKEKIDNIEFIGNAPFASQDKDTLLVGHTGDLYKFEQTKPLSKDVGEEFSYILNPR